MHERQTQENQTPDGCLVALLTYPEAHILAIAVTSSALSLELGDTRLEQMAAFLVTNTIGVVGYSSYYWLKERLSNSRS